MQQRIGIDVGGTNTDAVLMQGQEVVDWVKTPTTADVTSGIVTALQELLQQTTAVPSDIRGVMLGTTHFTNAVVQRRHLSPVAAVRLGLPATTCVPLLTDWPEDLRELVGQVTYMLPGGHEVDGRPIVPFEPPAMERAAHDIKARGITDVAITSVFSPVDPSLERQAAAIVQHVVPEATVTLSCDIGRLGLLERENAAVMNACLRRLGRTTVQAFRQALAMVGLHAPLFLTQNDGTLMSAAYAEQYPVLTFASGPTNSMRGAAFLTGVADAIGQMIADSVDRMKMSAAPVPLIAVGGGSFLVPDALAEVSQVRRAPHYAVANAVGAAIAQISGEVDHTVTLGTRSRDEALAQAKALAVERAITAGAYPDTVQVIDVEEIPLTYLPSNALRIRVKAVGDLHLAN